MLRFQGVLVALLCTLPLFFPTVRAASFEEKTYEIGISGGFVLPGDVYVSLHGDDAKRNSNLLIRGFIDSYVVPKLAVGAYLNFSTLNLKEDIEIGFYGDDEDYDIEKSGIKIFEIGGTIKPRFMLSPKFAIKPGFNIGYRKYFGDTDFSTWEAMGINGSCEFQYQYSPKIIIYEETGFLSQPVGGNVDTDITFGPTFYLLLGVAI